MSTNTAVHPSVTICQHPIIQHNLTQVRNKNTDGEGFRAAMTRIGRIVFQAATQDLPLSQTTVETPLCQTNAQQLSPEVPIIIAPILRAALMLGDVAMELIPTASVYHLGLYRDEETCRPITYYNKLPASINYPRARVFVLDPMLATGGSATAALEIIRAQGVLPENIRFVCIIAAPEGIQALITAHPGVQIFTANVDEKLNDKSYIIPGLGDAGDRAFGTV